jgi:hypothetical protein
VGATIHEVDSRHVPMLSNPKLVIEVITAQQTPNSAMEPTASRRMKRLKDEVKAKLALARRG